MPSLLLSLSYPWFPRAFIFESGHYWRLLLQWLRIQKVRMNISKVENYLPKFSWFLPRFLLVFSGCLGSNLRKVVTKVPYYWWPSVPECNPQNGGQCRQQNLIETVSVWLERNLIDAASPMAGRKEDCLGKSGVWHWQCRRTVVPLHVTSQTWRFILHNDIMQVRRIIVISREYCESVTGVSRVKEWV
jgi:hypothetical protein